MFSAIKVNLLIQWHAYSSIALHLKIIVFTLDTSLLKVRTAVKVDPKYPADQQSSLHMHQLSSYHNFKLR